MRQTPEDAALEVWNEVLETMPVELHSRYALTEARRRLIGEPDEQALAMLIEQHAVAAFGADQVPGDARRSDIFPNSPERSSTEAEVLQQVLAAVYDGFAATTDGSAERAAVLENRAIA